MEFLIKYSSGVLLILVFITNSCMSSHEYRDRESLEKCFDNSFGFPPPNSIAEIKVKDHLIRDSWIFFMKFTYNEVVVDKIINTNFMDSVSNDKIRSAKSSAFEDYPSKPDWFEKPDDKAKLYFGKGDVEHWPFCSEIFWVDKDKEYVFYINQGNDW